MTAEIEIAVASPSSVHHGDVVVGDAIPTTELPLTLQRLVIEAGVNRDYTPTHHDAELAVASGAPAPYANTPMILAMLEAGLRNWMGVEGRLLELDFRMRRFNTVGSVLCVGGRVVGVGDLLDTDYAELDPLAWGRTDLECWIEVDGYRNVEGTAAVALARWQSPTA